MKKKRKIICFSLTVLCFSIFNGSITNAKIKKEKELNSKDITLIKNVYPTGEKVSAVVCDFGTVVDSPNLSVENFQIESVSNGQIAKRTISKVYTNNAIKTSDKPKAGRYVIIELYPNDENSSTLTYNEQVD